MLLSEFSVHDVSLYVVYIAACDVTYFADLKASSAFTYVIVCFVRAEHMLLYNSIPHVYVIPWCLPFIRVYDILSWKICCLRCFLWEHVRHADLINKMYSFGMCKVIATLPVLKRQRAQLTSVVTAPLISLMYTAAERFNSTNREILPLCSTTVLVFSYRYQTFRQYSNGIVVNKDVIKFRRNGKHLRFSTKQKFVFYTFISHSKPFRLKTGKETETEVTGQLFLAFCG